MAKQKPKTSAELIADAEAAIAERQQDTGKDSSTRALEALVPLVKSLLPKAKA